MPIIEYICRKCGKRFEFFHRVQANDCDVTCPECNSAEVKRTVSRFAAVAKTAFGSCPASRLCPEKLHAKYGKPESSPCNCEGCAYHHDS